MAEANASDFDALVLPGGVVNADHLRVDKDAQDFTRSFFEQHKPVASICHGPWLLIDAGVIRGRNVTSYHTLQTDLKNAGANWSDEEVVVDQGLVTSRNPGDLHAFNGKLWRKSRKASTPARPPKESARSAAVTVSGPSWQLWTGIGMTRQVESIEDGAGGVVYYHRHENGGGFVGRGAVVADLVRLGTMTSCRAARADRSLHQGGTRQLDRPQRAGGGADRYRRRRACWPRDRSSVTACTSAAIRGLAPAPSLGMAPGWPTDSSVPDGGRVAAQPRRRAAAVADKRQRVRQPQKKLAA